MGDSTRHRARLSRDLPAERDMTRVLVTGGAGFIGSHLVDQLLARGDVVLVVDNFATARRDSLSEHDNLRFEQGDVADTQFVNAIFSEFAPAVVVHAAASYKDPANWTEDARTNTVGTANVVKAAQDAAVTRFVYFQTALCYGLHPFAQPIPLTHPLDPSGSSYAISKTAGEWYVRLSDLDWISFRLANVYGPRNLSGPLPTFYRRLSEVQPVVVVDTRRDFVFVDDLVAVALQAIDGRGAIGIYHVSSGSDVSIEELFEATRAAMGIELDEPVEVRPRNPDDAPSILLDPIKTEHDFEWAARVPLREGVAKAVEYYREYGVTETFTHLRSLETK
jgi:UDP-glucose 4-epimerase